MTVQTPTDLKTHRELKFVLLFSLFPFYGYEDDILSAGWRVLASVLPLESTYQSVHVHLKKLALSSVSVLSISLSDFFSRTGSSFGDRTSSVMLGVLPALQSENDQHHLKAPSMHQFDCFLLMICICTNVFLLPATLIWMLGGSKMKYVSVEFQVNVIYRPLLTTFL